MTDTPIKRGTARRLGIRRPDVRPVGIIRFHQPIAEGEAEQFVRRLRATLGKTSLVTTSFEFSPTPIKRPWWKRWFQ